MANFEDLSQEFRGMKSRLPDGTHDAAVAVMVLTAKLTELVENGAIRISVHTPPGPFNIVNK